MTLAVVIGAGGGIGHACADLLAANHRWTDVLRLGRRSIPPLDVLSEPSVAAAASWAAGQGSIGLVLVATGFLHDQRFRPERSWRELDATHMAHAFAVNAIGPALLMKHFCPRLPRQGRVVFAALSARVGSIGDNHRGGWHSYRASKAALNQLIRTTAIELRRHNPDSVCVALHPGTVDTALSKPFEKAGLDVRSAEVAAADVLAVIDGLTPAQSGGFVDQRGKTIEW